MAQERRQGARGAAAGVSRETFLVGAIRRGARRAARHVLPGECAALAASPTPLAFSRIYF